MLSELLAEAESALRKVAQATLDNGCLPNGNPLTDEKREEIEGIAKGFDVGQAIHRYHFDKSLTEGEREQLKKLITDNPGEVSSSITPKVMITKNHRDGEPADDAERSDDDEQGAARKRERDQIVKEALTALDEERAELANKLEELRHQPGKEHTMTTFETEVAKARESGLSRHQAMSAARSANPAAYAEYQRGGQEKVAEAVAKSDVRRVRLVKSAAQNEFEAVVKRIASDERISMEKAAPKARRQYADLFKRAYPEAARR